MPGYINPVLYHQIMNWEPDRPRPDRAVGERALCSAPLTKEQSISSHHVTYMIMSGLVALFINIVFGSIAVACSIHSFHLLQRPDPASARRWGHIAFVLNVLGILSTMLLVILVFRLKFNDKPIAH